MAATTTRIREVILHRILRAPQEDEASNNNAAVDKILYYIENMEQVDALEVRFCQGPHEQLILEFRSDLVQLEILNRISSAFDRRDACGIVRELLAERHEHLYLEERVQERALSALGRLLLEGGVVNEQAIATRNAIVTYPSARGIIGAIIQSMDRHPTNLEIQRHGCNILLRLPWRRDMQLADFILTLALFYGATVDTVMMLGLNEIHGHEDNNDTNSGEADGDDDDHDVTTMAGLFDYETARTIFREGGFSTILRAIEKHGKDPRHGGGVEEDNVDLFVQAADMVNARWMHDRLVPLLPSPVGLLSSVMILSFMSLQIPPAEWSVGSFLKVRVNKRLWSLVIGIVVYDFVLN